MGRMLDTLKRAEWPTTEAPPPAAQTAEPTEAAMEEIPYIEVGGPFRKVEASPAVWVTNTVRPATEVPATTLKKPALHTPPPRGVTLTPRAPLTVALQAAAPAEALTPRLASEIIAFHQPEHAVSQQYRTLLEKILGEVSGTPNRALLFAALTPGAGTTTTVLNLAVWGAADARRQVVIVDANLQRPVVGKRLGLAAAPGLREVLSGSAALEQVIQTTVQERLHALPAGVGTGQMTVLSGEAIGWVVRWLRERYDLVLFDGAAWQNTREAADLAVEVDAVYLVVDDGQTGQPAVKAATRSLAQFGARLGGLIVTQ